MMMSEAPMPKVPQSDVESALNLQRVVSNDLHELISTLEKRVDIALRAPSPSPFGEDSCATANVTSRLCETIEGNTDQVRGANRRLSALIDRLTT